MAQEYGQLYVDRSIGSLPSLLKYALHEGWDEPSGILIVRKHDYAVWQAHGALFEYHPGMAVHRIRSLSAGGTDPMIEAMELQPGDTVLDCTAGLCSDALVASHVMGESGRMLALEASLPIALTVRKGLTTYETDRKYITQAMRRVEVQAARAEHVLPTLASESWDVVYFDPMFEVPVMESTGIGALRTLADPSPLTVETLRQAARVARRAVVIKDRQEGPWWSRSGFSRHVGRRKGRFGYIVLEGEERRRLLEGEVPW